MKEANRKDQCTGHFREMPLQISGIAGWTVEWTFGWIVG
jgi:hypothetical protein